MATFVSGTCMSRFYNLNIRFAPIVNRSPYSSLRKRDIRASCHRYLPMHSFSLTTQGAEVIAWDCVGYERNVVKLKGLPWRTTSEEVVKFLGDRVSLLGGKSGVYCPMARNNLPSGQAYVKLADNESVQQAKQKSGEMLKDRKVLVSTCSIEELTLASKLARHHQKMYESEAVNVVCQIVKPGQKLTELSELAIEDIAEFFADFEIVPNGIIQTPKKPAGSSNGSMKVAAHVKFASLKMAQEALLRDGKMIKDCQIGVYRSTRSMSEAKAAITPIPCSEFQVYMKDIPATASEHDIIEFFTSAGVTPVSVFFFQNRWDVLKVGVFVNFGNKGDIEKALKCDKNSIDDTSVRVTPPRRQAESMTD